MDTRNRHSSGIQFAVPIQIRDGEGRAATIAGVDQALKLIARLPHAHWVLPRWQNARDALRAARRNPGDEKLTVIAQTALRTALLAQGWLR